MTSIQRHHTRPSRCYSTSPPLASARTRQHERQARQCPEAWSSAAAARTRRSVRGTAEEKLAHQFERNQHSTLARLAHHSKVNRQLLADFLEEIGIVERAIAIRQKNGEYRASQIPRGISRKMTPTDTMRLQHQQRVTRIKSQRLLNAIRQNQRCALYRMKRAYALNTALVNDFCREWLNIPTEDTGAYEDITSNPSRQLTEEWEEGLCDLYDCKCNNELPNGKGNITSKTARGESSMKTESEKVPRNMHSYDNVSANFRRERNNKCTRVNSYGKLSAHKAHFSRRVKTSLPRKVDTSTATSIATRRHVQQSQIPFCGEQLECLVSKPQYRRATVKEEKVAYAQTTAQHIMQESKRISNKIVKQDTENKMINESTAAQSRSRHLSTETNTLEQYNKVKNTDKVDDPSKTINQDYYGLKSEQSFVSPSRDNSWQYLASQSCSVEESGKILKRLFLADSGITTKQYLTNKGIDDVRSYMLGSRDDAHKTESTISDSLEKQLKEEHTHRYRPKELDKSAEEKIIASCSKAADSKANEHCNLETKTNTLMKLQIADNNDDRRTINDEQHMKSMNNDSDDALTVLSKTMDNNITIPELEAGARDIIKLMEKMYCEGSVLSSESESKRRGNTTCARKTENDSGEIQIKHKRYFIGDGEKINENREAELSRIETTYVTDPSTNSTKNTENINGEFSVEEKNGRASKLSLISEESYTTESTQSYNKVTKHVISEAESKTVQTVINTTPNTNDSVMQIAESKENCSNANSHSNEKGKHISKPNLKLPRNVEEKHRTDKRSKHQQMSTSMCNTWCHLASSVLNRTNTQRQAVATGNLITKSETKRTRENDRSGTRGSNGIDTKVDKYLMRRMVKARRESQQWPEKGRHRVKKIYQFPPVYHKMTQVSSSDIFYDTNNPVPSALGMGAMVTLFIAILTFGQLIW